MNNDTYFDLAEKYDYMLPADDKRSEFFEKLFENHHVKSLLDCSCGTGSDLIMFKSFVDHVTGSDISNSMLEVAKGKIKKANLDIGLKKVDFRYLESYGLMNYDAIVCLSSSICEIHSDDDAITAIQSMFDSLNDNGILIIDQGQTDGMMKSRPRFIPVINNREISRLFVIDYLDGSNAFITVNICDMEHTEEKCTFSLNLFKLRIRLIDDWKDLLLKAGIANYQIYGSWEMDDYDKTSSKRIIINAMKKNEKMS